MDCECECECECDCECTLPPDPNMAAAAVEEDGRETFGPFGMSGRENAAGFEFAFTLEVVAFVLLLVLLGGKGAGFCDILELSAFSLLILLVGAAALFVSGFDAASMDDGLCEGCAGVEEEEVADAFLRSVLDGCS